VTRYYLDTTAHLERHCGSAEVRREAAKLLDGERHATSTHVYREWKRIVDGAATDILNALRTSSEMRDVYARLAQGRGRSPGQRLRVLAMLAGGELTTDTLGIRARTFLRSQSRALFEASVDDVRNGSDCGLAKELPRLRSGQWELKTTCKKTECECRQPDFLSDQSPRGERAARALDDPGAREPDRKMGRTADKILRSGRPLDRKGKNCWGGTLGGDISIALECGSDEVLLSTDESFNFICRALGLQQHRLSATPPP
jgi:hypothetical protein